MYINFSYKYKNHLYKTYFLLFNRIKDIVYFCRIIIFLVFFMERIMSKKEKKKASAIPVEDNLVTPNSSQIEEDVINKNPVENKEEIITEDSSDSVSVIVSKDKNEITDAADDAIKEVNAIAYADNLKVPANTAENNSTVSPKSDETRSETAKDTSTYTAVKEKKSRKKCYIILGVLLLLIILAFLFSTVFALCNIPNEKILGGISINGIDVSHLTKQEAEEKVNAALSQKLQTPLTLQHNDYETTVFAEQFDVSFDVTKAVDMAYQIGRTGNLFENNFTIIKTLFSKTSICAGLSYSEETLNSLITEIENSLPDRLIQPSYYIDSGQLIITKGQNGVTIDATGLKDAIIYAMNNIQSDISTITIPVNQVNANSIDIAAIHQEIYKEPQDAYYTTNPYVVHPHVNGLDFSISLEETTAMLAEDKESYVIPLKELTPKVTTNQIGTEAFPDLLGSFSTTYSTKNTNRSTNIRLASSKINGTVLMPGETFSYNQVVGKRTAAAGYKSAAVYANGEVTTGIGGGICQVSSTLYNAVLYANLEIVARTNHGFNPGYVKAGRDATVSWGGPDFKFKNNRDYPIKIVCSGTGGKINFQIFGMKTDNDYEVEIESNVVQTIAYKTVYQDDSSLAKGKTKVIQSGSNGCKTETYKILKKNGKVVSRTLLSKDTYNPHNKVVARGTK